MTNVKNTIGESMISECTTIVVVKAVSRPHAVCGREAKNKKNAIPTLGGNDGFENNKQNVNSPGQSRLQKSKNHVDIVRKRVFLAFSPQRG